MNNVNKTLYIPLYGKSYVSKKGIILHDKHAEDIWSAENFKLKGKSQSKWLAYYMGMRSAVFDNWTKTHLHKSEDSIIIHIGCGMDSRIERVGTQQHLWYDIDLPDVIKERKRYFSESEYYHMVAADVRDDSWLNSVPSGKNAIILMEGVSMYFNFEELESLLKNICHHFKAVNILMDCYTSFAAKASKYKNPINDVGVSIVYGLDEPDLLTQNTGLSFVTEHEMTPPALINQLKGVERTIFKLVFGGKISKKMYRLYEFMK